MQLCLSSYTFTCAKSCGINREIQREKLNTEYLITIIYYKCSSNNVTTCTLISKSTATTMYVAGVYKR